MEKYFQNPGLSQSELKNYLMHPRLIGKAVKEDDLYYNEDSSFTKGSLLDLYITNQDTANSIFEKEYFVLPSSEYKVSDTLRNILKKIYLIEPAKNLSDVSFDTIQHVCNEVQYFLNRFKPDAPVKEDSRVLGILNSEDNHIYWQNYHKSQGKILITEEELEKIFLMRSAIMSNKYIAPYFEMETLYQKDLYGTINGIPRKGLLDIVFIDHTNRIVWITDLKSTSDYISRFPYSFFKYRYDIQGDWYTDLMKENDLFPGYTIRFQIIASSFAEPTFPEIFRPSEKVMKEARYGNAENFKIGWEELLERYAFHKEFGFEYSKNYITNNGANIIE